MGHFVAMGQQPAETLELADAHTTSFGQPAHPCSAHTNKFVRVLASVVRDELVVDSLP